MTCGAIILCGGKSTRMGLSKAAMPFGPESMLERIVRRLGSVCDCVVVVAAEGQSLPALTEGTLVARDRHPQRGPLEALAAGMAALPVGVEAAFVTGCDVPLLEPAVVERMFALLGEDSIAVPVCGGFHHPLAAVYRRSILPVIEELLSSDRLRAGLLFDCVPTRRVGEQQLREVDPGLESLKNVNEPESYLAALRQAGFEAPAEVLEQLERKVQT